MDFKPFYDDWIIIDPIFIPSNISLRKYDYVNVNLSYDFFSQLTFTEDSLKTYRINAALEASKILGEKPALCISGGIDSQAMLHCWLEADIKFDVFVLVFKNNLNSMDVEQARLVCRNLGIELKEIEIDIIKFLNYYNYEYAVQYQSCSPHFNTHYKLFNILKNMGYTGVCCGGDAPIYNPLEDIWGSNYNKNTQNFVQYSRVSRFPCIGNFLGYYPKLAWSISLQTKPVTPNHNQGMNTLHNNILTEQNDYVIRTSIKDLEEQRYLYKCDGYNKTGIKIIPQTQKFSGFELVKKHLEEVTGDGWAFEKRYRRPLENLLNVTTSTPVFVFDANVEKLIKTILLNNIGDQFITIT